MYVPEEADFVRQGKAQGLGDGGDGIPESEAIDDIVREELGVLKGEGTIAHHQLPHLFPPLIKNRPGAEVKLPL